MAFASAPVAATLDLVHGFGVRADLVDSVVFAHESDVLFGCGRHVAAQAIDDADMHFASLGADVEATVRSRPRRAAGRASGSSVSIDAAWRRRSWRWPWIRATCSWP